MRKYCCLIAAMAAFSCVAQAARADLASAFSGYTVVGGAGVSGYQSSYYTAVNAGNPVSGITALPTLSNQRISYPSVGALPSPGAYDSNAGRFFDIGMIGVRFVGNQITVQIASAINPLTGVNYGGTNYNIGDVFITVDDAAAGVKQFSLLSEWARAGSSVLSLNGGYYGAAQTYHTSGGAGGTSLEGHLVSLNANTQVSTTGGTGAYTAANGVVGLDRRAFANGGADLGNANIAFGSTTDIGMAGSQTFYLESWTFNRSLLSTDATFNLALHATVSCGNDEIDGIFNAPTQVPAPGAGLLGVMGLGAIGAIRRRLA